MSLFKDWILRKRSAKPRLDSATSSSVQRTISDALSAAGLTSGATRPQGSVWTGLRKRAPSREGRPIPSPTARSDEPGRSFWSAVGIGADALDYLVYVPASYANRAESVPLIVMLHGCTQDPEDFARGTRMNVLAESAGAIVAYPLQPKHANPQKCWNWFSPNDQMRNSGEPKRIAAMTRHLIDTYRIDRSRVFVAGMSAGGAMALIMARTYPDLFAAAGVHSGLPYRCANNVVSALSAMRDSSSGHPDGGSSLNQTSLIVFHGDHDRTVSPGNGDTIVRQALQHWPASASFSRETVNVFEDQREGQRTVFRDQAGDAVIEQWSILGGGHLWSGGDAHGSHTDANGPNASAHMMRFFLEHRPRRV